MSRDPIKAVLLESFNKLKPFSNHYLNHVSRYLYTLKYICTLPSAQVGKVLDIGTGVGVLPLTLKELGYSAEGLDYFIFPENKKGQFSTKSISDTEELKAVWKKFDLVVHEKNIMAGEIDLSDQYDLVTSEALIEHLRDPKTFLGNCNKLLCVGGYLLIATPNQSSLLNRMRFLFGKSVYWPVEEFFADGENFIGHWREYTMDELRKMVTKSGFEVIETCNINLLSPMKKWPDWRRNLRALIKNLSFLFPGTRDMNYLLAKKVTSLPSR